METEKYFNYIFYTSDDMCRAPCVCVCMHEMYLVRGVGRMLVWRVIEGASMWASPMCRRMCKWRKIRVLIENNGPAIQVVQTACLKFKAYVVDVDA